MKAEIYIGAAGVPAGWELVHSEAVPHPRDKVMGALIRNKNTGAYALLNAGVTRSFPKSKGDWLAGIKNEEWGGARAGAGRPRVNRTAVCWRLSDDEKVYLRKCLEEYRAKKAE